MNLQQLHESLPTLYPLLRTRSGQQIITHSAEGAVKPDGLVVTVKTLFPPSERRRTELVVTDVAGGVSIRAIEASARADGQRFAELVRNRWEAAATEAAATLPGPLRCVKDSEGRVCFTVTEAVTTAAAPEADEDHRDTDAATPAAKRNENRES